MCVDSGSISLYITAKHWVTWAIFWLSRLIACVWYTRHEVQGMLPNKSSEDLENIEKLLQNTYQLAFLKKVWLCSFGRKWPKLDF